MMKKKRKLHSIERLVEFIRKYNSTECYLVSTNNNFRLTIVNIGSVIEHTYTIQYSTKGKLAYFYDDEFYFSESDFVNHLIENLKKDELFNLKFL